MTKTYEIAVSKTIELGVVLVIRADDETTARAIALEQAPEGFGWDVQDVRLDAEVLAEIPANEDEPRMGACDPT